MDVKIAGYNIDESLIKKLPDQQLATPETISAAYARISRSKKNVTQLRKVSLNEVKKARQSNETIIFEMGHSSIAEHAVFNIDIIGVSRYLSEFIQRTRLASFTEKSQRYVTLDGDFVIPHEIKNSSLESEFTTIINQQNQIYKKLFEKSIEYLKKNQFEGKKRDLEGKAKEDARYVLALATQTQMGMTINARSLARLLKRLDCIKLEEANTLKRLLEDQVKKIAPSLLRYTDADQFDKFNVELPYQSSNTLPDFRLINISNQPDDVILASILFEETGDDYERIVNYISKMKVSEKEHFYNQIFCNLKSYHSAPRHFEMVQATFQIPMSSSCFAQWKRHRLSTIIKSDYNPQFGYMIPPLIRQMNMDEEIKKLYNDVYKCYFELEAKKKGLGNYILTNANKLVILFQANLRELYHFSRLRSDKHAQWEIRVLSQKMDKILRDKIPLAAKCIMGKHEFDSKSI